MWSFCFEEKIKLTIFCELIMRGRKKAGNISSPFVSCQSCNTTGKLPYTFPFPIWCILPASFLLLCYPSEGIFMAQVTEGRECDLALRISWESSPFSHHLWWAVFNWVFKEICLLRFCFTHIMGDIPRAVPLWEIIRWRWSKYWRIFTEL